MMRCPGVLSIDLKLPRIVSGEPLALSPSRKNKNNNKEFKSFR